MARGRVVRKLHLAHSQGGHGSDGPAPATSPQPRTAQTSLLAPSAPWRPNWEFSLCCAKAVRGARQGLPLTCHRDRSDLFILV